MTRLEQGSGYRRRKLANAVMLALMGLANLVVIGFLLAVLGYVLVQGGSALNLAFFTETPKPVGEVGGGMANAIVGTLVLVGLACLLGLPVGIGAGVYLAEYGRGSRLATLVRFTTDVLTGIPSITIGLFAYAIAPYDDWHRQAWAGALVLVGLVLVLSATARFIGARSGPNR